MPQKIYDLVVVGGGMGGLACGVFFAKEGLEVCVLERNKQIGGNLQTYARNKVIFDSGVHYVGGLSDGQNLNQIFRYFGIMDKLKIQKMDDDVMDAIIFASEPEKIYRHAQGYDRFIKNLVEDFPEEEQAIQKYCDELRRICQKFPLYNLREGQPFEKNDVLSLDTRAFVESITNNEKLQNVLCGSNLLYAGEADKSPLYMHALIINHYIEGAHRFIDGGSQIARLLTREIRNAGGVVKTRREVIRMQETDGRIEYAECRDGERYYGKNFISNAHPAQTLNLVQSEVIKKAYRNRMTNLENSISVFSINIVLHKKSFPYRNHNIYFFNVDDVWCGTKYKPEEWPCGFAAFFSTRSNQDEFADGITLMTYMRYEEMAPWKETFNTVTEEDNRGEGYENFKKEKAEQLIDQAEKVMPGLRASIDSYYVATPLTVRDYIGTTDGSLYGVTKDYRDPLKTFISPRTKIPNLFHTGQNLNLHGILGVTMSAIVTSAEFFGMGYLLNKIRNA